MFERSAVHDLHFGADLHEEQQVKGSSLLFGVASQERFKSLRIDRFACGSNIGKMPSRNI